MTQLSEPASPDHPDGRIEPGVVEQASDVIAARDGVSRFDALVGLRHYAATTQQPLLAICAAVVVGRISPNLGMTTRQQTPLGGRHARPMIQSKP